MIARALASIVGERAAARSIDPFDPKDPALAKLFGFGTPAKSGVRVDGETVLGIPAVLRAVNILSNALMKVRPIIYERAPGAHEADRERDHDHPSWKFVTRRANDLMSAGFFRKTLTAWAILRGNGLGYLVRDGAGRIVEGIPLLPDRSGMAVFRNGQQLPGDSPVQQGDKILYWTQVGGELRKLLPENVIHIKSLSNNGYWGYDLVDLLCESFGLSIAPRDFSANFFGRAAVPSGIVFAPTGLKEEQQEKFAEKIRAAGEGLGRSHRMLILEDTAKYEQVSIDPEKAQMLQTREFERVEIANIVGIQSHKIGDSARVAYNSLEMSNQEHLDDDLDPLLQTWEDEYGEKCLTEKEKESESHYVEFNRKALVRVNLAARTARHQFERTYGLATANDILRQENQSPLGDVGDTYLVPANMNVLNADGVPIIRGAAAPSGSGEGGSKAATDDDRREMALHLASQLARRTTREALRRAKQGGGAYLEFLDELAATDHQPRAAAAVLGAAAERLHAELAEFANPPHAAADLAANVAASVDGIAAAAIAAAAHYLEENL